MASTGVYANGYYIPAAEPVVYDAAITGGGSGGASMVSPSRSSVDVMTIERHISKIGIFMGVHDPELMAILVGEFI